MTAFLIANSVVKATPDHVIAEIFAEKYTRVVGMPADLNLIGDFSLREQILSLFLGSSRVRYGRILFKFPNYRRYS
jgi:hypothetical protein